MTDPQIPFGYRRIRGPLQKGDGIWNGTRFAKVKKQYPNTEYAEVFAIRKCEVVQTELPHSPDCACLWCRGVTGYEPDEPGSVPVMDLDE